MQHSVEPGDLDTGTLALFVGFAASGLVQDQLAEDGFSDLRFSHGYVFQHLIEAQPTIGELAADLDMTQQGASKAVAELEQLGYTERVPDYRDARVRRVQLTPRGREAVEASRRARAALEERLTGRFGKSRLAGQKQLLAQLLDELGGTAAVRTRGVRPPR
ncbi:MAG TPA: MarR family winged helix-turn-helix transcriptional regulator [Streptomyces sp.]|jgi:DNA-binding MarR family transcriptional regulator|nr:MarR family winged helix-turn-helix transcriptional regulator [Streptomyces sp.]